MSELQGIKDVADIFKEFNRSQRRILRELGFHTVESLAGATATELELAGITKKRALEVIRVARSSIALSFIKADWMLKIREKILQMKPEEIDKKFWESPTQVLDKEVARLKRLGKVFRELEFSEAWDCPCCHTKCLLASAYFASPKRRKWRHKHRIFNISRNRFEGPWV